MSENIRMLHVNLCPGEVGRYAIVPGDPDRCELIAAHLENPRLVTGHAGGRAHHRDLHRHRRPFRRHLH